MSSLRAREGDTLVETPVNAIAQMLEGRNGKLKFHEVYVRGHQCVPDGRCLAKSPWGANEVVRDVFITKIVGQCKGLAFCRFRAVEPADVSPTARLGFGVPWSEQIRFVGIENGELVLEYQAILSDVFWYDDGVKSESVQFSVPPDMYGPNLVRRTAWDSDDRGCGWQFFCDREFIEVLGGKGSPHGPSFHSSFYIQSEDVSRQLLELFPETEIHDRY